MNICLRRFFMIRRWKQWQCCCCLLILVPVLIVASVDTCSPWLYSMFSVRQYCSAEEHVRSYKNPLLDNSGLPKFREIEAKHVVPGLTKLLKDVEKQLESLEVKLSDPNIQPSWSEIFDPLEKMGFPLEYSWGVVNHLNGVRNHDELRKAYEDVQPSVVKVSTKLAQSLPLYNAMKELYHSGNPLDGPQRRILKSSLRGARLSGVELKGAQQERFNQITLQLAKLSTDFNNNVLDATKAFRLDLTDPADVKDLPESLKQLMAANAAEGQSFDADKGPWRVTLDGPCIDPFLKHSRERSLREAVYRGYITRASGDPHDNSEIIENIRTLRQEQSQILGYSNYAEVSLTSKMAENPQNVWKLIHSLKQKSKDAAEREHQQLQEFADANGQEGGALRQWDVAFWSERQREHLFSFNDEDLRPYFPLPVVLEGLFNLTSFLFGIKIKPSDDNVQVWCDDVRFFDVLDERGQHIASFYLDPYTRPAEKRGGAWMDQCLGRSDFLKTKPVAYLVCNQTPPQKDKPSLMTFREVETLFHEFGHGLQHMLTTVPYAPAAGIANVEWDAVELPSQFMENWLYDDNTMKLVSRHYQSGEPLLPELFKKVTEARKFRAGNFMMRQLHFSALDMELHTSSDHWRDVKKRIDDEYSLSSLPPLKEDMFPCSFMHIFGGGYAAGYYSYKWAEVLAADAFSAFEEAGLSNKENLSRTGRRFRDTVLSLGGGTHPTDVFKRFRGREPEPDALLKLYGLT